MLHTSLKATFILLFLSLAWMAAVAPSQATSAPPAAVVQSSPDFTMSVTPVFASRKRGSGEPYTITIQAVNGFTGTVDFTVTGLFPGASIPIPPEPVTGSGLSGFDVLTEHPPTTPIGTFTLTITGTSGSLSHSQQVTLQMR